MHQGKNVKQQLRCTMLHCPHMEPYLYEMNKCIRKYLDKDILDLKSSKSNYIKYGNSEYINYMNYDDSVN